MKRRDDLHHTPVLIPGRAGLAGFTLIEVLVALSLVAVAMAAGMRAMGALTRNAERQTDVLLARLCSENVLVQMQLSRQMPGSGSSTQNCDQAGVSYVVEQTITPTPNPNFRRVETRVTRDGLGVSYLTSIVGRY